MDKQRIKVLPPHEARRVAAGEVIDRPAALAREFLDNAIDADAKNIEVLIEEGGCKKVEVADDGDGMSREDLELCHLDHATSKIRSLDDLQTALTLGFRGEALAAAAAVSRLEIVSSAGGDQAWRLEKSPDSPPILERRDRVKGATVRAHCLFENIPARKRFLKREGSEGNLCHQVFIDKALAFPMINFRFIQDGKLRDFFPAVLSKKERFSGAVLQTGQSDFIHEINVTGTGFNAAIVIGGCELYRNDRRQIYVFVNGRRVQDYSIIQAVEYGCQGWFPNGTHPVAAVYIDIDPALADFNIHPAKKEVRFRDPGAIHHAVSGAVKSFFHKTEIGKIAREGVEKDMELGIESAEYGYPAENAARYQSEREANDAPVSYFTFPINSIREKNAEINSSTEKNAVANGDIRYAGRVFGLFILIEWGDKLYLIDQHAAHERILFDRFLSEPIPKQELLAPIPFAAESDEEDAFLEAKRGELSRLGVEIAKDEDGGLWRVEALPADWRMGDAETVREILELRNAGENMARRWAATLCCRAAIKDGDYPDEKTAFALGRQALELPDPRCPHGRPIWTEISRDALFKAVRRE